MVYIFIHKLIDTRATEKDVGKSSLHFLYIYILIRY